MIQRLLGFLLVAICLAAVADAAPEPAGSYPTPSLYPVAWQFNFDHSAPKRIVVKSPGDATPVAYWYMSYGVTNTTGQERMFLPYILMLTDDGTLIRSDDNIPPAVFAAIKNRENNKFLESPTTIAGELRVGEDQARESVAIWREPKARMGAFMIFITGLSGETATIAGADGQPAKDADGNPIMLRKTLQLSYKIAGDEVYPGEDAVNGESEAWIMR